jgi:GH43 family beta-xylosidase
MFSPADSSVSAKPSADLVSATFQNPIAPGADPWVVRHAGAYYWCVSHRDLGVAVYRSDTLTGMGEKFVVWLAPDSGPHSQQVWAPELHWLDGRWYIYVAASNGQNENHRMIVLESSGADPTAPFRFKAELYLGDHIATKQLNRWAIDGTVLEHAGKRYFLWSGWHDGRDRQWLYIAQMENPWTITTNRVRICANDDYRWERVGERRSGRGLNEAPQVLQRNGRVFIVYSASASWECCYKLGLIELAPDKDPLDARSWRKHPEPVFKASEYTWGVGHCSFTRSPDDREDWIVFHAKVDTQPGWNRAIHLQRFEWDADGRPDFGHAVRPGFALARPSGEVPLEVPTATIETVKVVETAASPVAVTATPARKSAPVLSPTEF